MKTPIRILCSLLCITLLFSCNNKKEKTEQHAATVNTPSQKPAKPEIEYGFNLADYILIHDTVRSGDSFGKIMNTYGISTGKVYQITNSIKDTFNSAHIVVGKPYTIVTTKADSAQTVAFIYQNDIINYTVVNFADSISATKHKRPVTIKRAAISGVINSSLSQAMDNAGASIELIHNLALLYQWKIDFFRIRKGDSFKVIYNKKYIDDTIYAGIDGIIAAEFSHYGEPYYAFHFGKDDASGFSKYYNQEGESLQSFFLKAPVEYTRISSRYTKRRFHPVQKRWKAHLGTDYAAPTGTPIHTTADGVVIASRYTRFNGNYVKVRHNSKYTTQYLHMSKRAVRVGEHVKQGEVIGYVGQTGLATGPHVCYRFWVNGKQVDPYKQDLPSSEPLADSLKPKFFKTIAPLKEELDNMQLKTPEDDVILAGVTADQNI